MPVFLPPKKTLEDLLEFCAHTPEAAKYFLDQFRQLLTQQNLLDKFSDLVSALTTFVENVCAEGEMKVGNPWAGEPMVRVEELRKMLEGPESDSVGMENAPSDIVHAPDLDNQETGPENTNPTSSN